MDWLSLLLGLDLGNNRTRHLDLMKIALEFTFPEQSSRLARNEAHVRLVCSIWYACCHLIYLAVIGILVAVVTNSVGRSVFSPLSGCLVGACFISDRTNMDKTKHRTIAASYENSGNRFRICAFSVCDSMAPKIMRVFAAGLLEMEGGDGRLVGQGTPKPTTVDGSSGLRRVVDRPSRAEAQHHRDRREGHIPQLALEHGGR